MARNDISRELIGRCGLYCGACDIYRAYVDKNENKQKRMAKYFKCKPSQVRCHGCQNLDQESWSTDCKILQCLKRNKYSYCYECNNTEICDIFQKLNRRYNNMPLENLKQLKKLGEERWLKKQNRRWTCPLCSKPFDYETEKCPSCGSDLHSN